MLGFGLFGGNNRWKTPGSKTANISTPTLSRAFCPKPTPLPTDAISITAGGQYQLYIAGVWTELSAVASTWGQLIATYLGLDNYLDLDNYVYEEVVSASRVRVARTSSDFYATPETAVLTIGLVDYTFTVTTITDPVG